MPEPLTIDEFVRETLEDIRCPQKSDFISKVSNVRLTVHAFDDGLEQDRTSLAKTKKLVRYIVSSGISRSAYTFSQKGHAESIFGLCEYMEKLSQGDLEGEEGSGNDVATGLCKFSVVHRDLANMFKHLMQNLNSIVVFPMEVYLQGDVKSDLKKPFERALRDYEIKYDKLRKEKLQVMKETGIFEPATFTAEMCEDLEKERRRLQLEMCEYLIKVNEFKSKRSTDFLQHLIDFYYAQLQ